MSHSVAAALGFCDGAGQTNVESRRAAFVPFVLFGRGGAGQVLAAATETRAQYQPASSMQDVTQTRPSAPSQDPAERQGAPEPAAQEPAGDRGGISRAAIVGGLIVLLVVLYFIAK